MHIAALRALRYNPDKISFIGRVVAPPYDMIEPDAAEELQRQDPHNVIHLILGKGGPELRPLAEYQRAAETLRLWRRQGVLVPEETFAMYPCEQAFELEGRRCVRRGVFCALQLDVSPHGRALPHESTLAGPRADRLMLMRECCANLSAVFGIFPDPDGQGDALLGEMADEFPLYEFCGKDGIAHRLWKVTDTDRIRRLAAALRACPFIIADGHHRYESALLYRERSRSSQGPPGTAPEDYVLAFCVSLKNPGLRALPTHRLARAAGSFDRSAFLQSVATRFNAEQLRFSGPDGLQQAVRSRVAPENHIACHLRGQALFLLTPKEQDPLAKAFPDRPAAWRQLPVTILHHMILQPEFALPAEPQEAQERLLYTQEVERAYWNVEGGRFDAGFLLPPTDPAAVEIIARAGQKMPPKSTFFYPKVTSGLVFYPFANGDCLPTVP